ncbi:hypothetical protein EMIHUDRAFT_218745 [Emiliania huxleyi CCMP1516]|uniref:Cysteine-rich DPF motif domain-containing protein 1 n=2 Tax=Emiliania huxleyi TaxID=2903 RepID=A0A0D3I6W1_EMIH1|nr:hypothetical protein EMIHUDRAFT_218745 [Emiliania huxleyi CCMP1516]EOD06996.1 hypothetical protein EMIHUDRAFT_218745 [Emiliania huxleyi CCMP1516]|eukprot:XP_005759425.1 hypothetical protein EMIHUDRAFT_218745 [Emiliania huxleyi CCMP1516]
MGAREPESETSFTCALCGFESRIDYIGNRPPWAPSVVFRERAYILRDPTNAATNHPLCIGASCSVWVVCAAPACSLFYTRRLCVACQTRTEIRLELPAELRKG